MTKAPRYVSAAVCPVPSHVEHSSTGGSWHSRLVHWCEYGFEARPVPVHSQHTIRPAGI